MKSGQRNQANAIGSFALINNWWLCAFNISLVQFSRQLLLKIKLFCLICTYYSFCYFKMNRDSREPPKKIDPTMSLLFLKQNSSTVSGEPSISQSNNLTSWKMIIFVFSYFIPCSELVLRDVNYICCCKHLFYWIIFRLPSNGKMGQNIFFSARVDLLS